MQTVYGNHPSFACAQAKASPRLRMNLGLRNSPEDGSQRMLNAIEPGTVCLYIGIGRRRRRWCAFAGISRSISTMRMVC